jgi:hypothetical protein
MNGRRAVLRAVRVGWKRMGFSFPCFSFLRVVRVGGTASGVGGSVSGRVAGTRCPDASSVD